MGREKKSKHIKYHTRHNREMKTTTMRKKKKVKENRVFGLLLSGDTLKKIFHLGVESFLSIFSRGILLRRHFLWENFCFSSTGKLFVAPPPLAPPPIFWGYLVHILWHYANLKAIIQLCYHNKHFSGGGKDQSYETRSFYHWGKRK